MEFVADWAKYKLRS